MWLAIDLAVVLLALILLVVFAVHAWARFRRMTRFGQRAGERVSKLADDAGRLGERVDSLAEQSESVDERTRDLAGVMDARTAAHEEPRIVPARRRTDR